jgi:hypothetical protein
MRASEQGEQNRKTWSMPVAGVVVVVAVVVGVVGVRARRGQDANIPPTVFSKTSLTLQSVAAKVISRSTHESATGVCRKWGNKKEESSLGDKRRGAGEQESMLNWNREKKKKLALTQSKAPEC